MANISLWLRILFFFINVFEFWGKNCSFLSGHTYYDRVTLQHTMPDLYLYTQRE